jgi:hypothetical protein
MDDRRPTVVRVLKDFVGLYSDSDITDIPNGAMAEQVNFFSLQLGALTTRGGIQEVETSALE